jgi:serine palmitoyltransferase
LLSNRWYSGTLIQHRKLESLLSEYLGTEDAVAFGMGFATNALNIPSLVGKVSSPSRRVGKHSSFIVEFIAGLFDTE